jgi:ABC-type dipeptide/oligopeptide/nickel transport system ATPase subunit
MANIPLLKLLDLSKINSAFSLINISFDLYLKDRLAILGPSGSGKSTLAKLIKGHITFSSGAIYYNNSSMTSKELLNSSDIQLVFQNCYDSLSPRVKIFQMLLESLKIRFKLDKLTAIAKIESLASELGINLCLLNKYPHELSGGEQQRIALLRALLVQPKVLICDEIVSSLDIDLQRQVLDCLLRYQKRNLFAIIFITHDLSLASSFCNRIMVVEEGMASHVQSIDECTSHSKHSFIKSSLEALEWFET